MPYGMKFSVRAESADQRSTSNESRTPAWWNAAYSKSRTDPAGIGGSASMSDVVIRWAIPKSG